MTEDRCEFSTTKPKGALSQGARSGSRTRYERCRNRAKHTVLIPHAGQGTAGREVRCCGLHKRMHETRGWLP